MAGKGKEKDKGKGKAEDKVKGKAKDKGKGKVEEKGKGKVRDKGKEKPLYDRSDDEEAVEFNRSSSSKGAERTPQTRVESKAGASSRQMLVLPQKEEKFQSPSRVTRHVARIPQNTSVSQEDEESDSHSEGDHIDDASQYSEEGYHEDIEDVDEDENIRVMDQDQDGDDQDEDVNKDEDEDMLDLGQRTNAKFEWPTIDDDCQAHYALSFFETEGRVAVWRMMMENRRSLLTEPWMAPDSSSTSIERVVAVLVRERALWLGIDRESPNFTDLIKRVCRRMSDWLSPAKQAKTLASRPKESLLKILNLRSPKGTDCASLTGISKKKLMLLLIWRATQDVITLQERRVPLDTSATKTLASVAKSSATLN